MIDPLKGYSIKASKKLGQHFLNNYDIVQKIVRATLPLKDELVLEVGPGLGILTQALLQEQVQKLICVEYDARCIDLLKATFVAEAKKLVLLNEDAVRFNEGKLLDAGQRFIIVSNLPYNISTALLAKWLKKIKLFKQMVLMFQKEVAERICAQPGTKQYGILSVLTQFLCVTRLEFCVPRAAFSPQPKVDSAVISIVPRENLDEKLEIYEKLEFLCKTVFNKRRKTLRNSIAPILATPEESLSSIGIDPKRRPETLSVAEFERIARKLVFF